MKNDHDVVIVSMARSPIGDFGGSFLPALLLGVAFGNIFQGIPLDETGFSQAGLFGLLV